MQSFTYSRGEDDQEYIFQIKLSKLMRESFKQMHVYASIQFVIHAFQFNTNWISK